VRVAAVSAGRLAYEGRWLALAATCCIALPATAASLGGAVAINTQLVDRGIAMTPATPVVQGSVFWIPASGWSLSLSGAAVTRSPTPLLQSSAAITRYWTLSDHWQMQAGLARSHYAIDQGLWRYTRTEANLGWTYQDMLSLTVSASRLTGGTRLYPAADLILRYPLTKQLALSAGLGAARSPTYTEPDDHVVGYRYGHAGLVWSQGNWTFEVDRMVTDGAPRPWDGPHVSPWAAMLSLAF
jgi:hypothetical protein